MFDMETSGFDDVQESLKSKEGTIIAATEEGTRAYAEFLLKRIQSTAPVETGEYKNDWRIEKRPSDERGDLFIVNSTEHGPYLVFPNQRMVGSQRADDPARGIIHNVRGIVKESEKDFQKSVLQKILDIFK